MPTSGTSVPVLIAAFVFGIVVNAASAALFLHVNGHGTAVFRDGQRLVLATFLLSAALWAQADFISIAIDPTATSSCQVGIIFSTFFDQFARFSVEQYLLWAINKGAKTGVQQMALQALVVVRFILGAVFVGFSRPQFYPVCVPMSSMLPVAIIVVALDAVLIVALAVAAFMAGMVGEVRQGRSGAGRSKSILLVIVAFALWTATSVTMLLGTDSIDLLLRTLLPAIGLLILVFIVTACNDALTTGTTTRAPRAPESPGIRNITTGRSISTDDSSEYPPSRFEDLKRSDIRSMSAFEQPREAPRPDVPPLPSNFSRSVVPGGNGGMPPLPVPTEAFVPAVSAAAASAAAASNVRKVDIRPQGPKTKRGLLALRGGPAAGKMTISDPILEANGEQNPLNKIATISLEDAARNERQRRANDLQRDSALIAKRPAPMPPGMSPEEAVKRSISLKRKEVASIGSQPPMPSASTLQPMPMAVTSSAQLSPGVEDLRRRSPRQPPADKEINRSTQAKSTVVSTMPVPSAPSPTLPLPPPRQEYTQQVSEVEMMYQVDQMELREEMDRMDQMDQLQQMNFVLEPQQTASEFVITPVVVTAAARQAKAENDLPEPPVGPDSSVRRPNIRPSRQLPQSPKTPPPEPSKTALQRRPTNGLPTNPRAMAVKALAKEASAGRQQTVMFMNNIVYDNPETVQSIIDDANIKDHERRSTQSVVHRPRPIPRHLEKDRAIFPAEPSPQAAGHRRSKSGGSIVGRKSILHSNPGSPTQLPPLPMPPMPTKNTGYKMERPSADRPQPNSTKSMTFDEKMTLLFPTPPSGEGAERRRSSVPDLPPMPLDYMPVALSPIEWYDGNSRMSQSTARTGRTSVKTENILEVDELPRRNNSNSTRARFSGDREQSMADDVGNSWLPGLAGDSMVILSDAPARPSMDAASVATGGRKRASSPVLPPVRDSTTTVSTDARTHEDTMTNWGSVHSPVFAVPIPANRQARTTYINGERGGPLLPATTYNARANSPPMSDEDDEQWQQGNPNRESQWHRRVGDDVLSFSDRKERTRSRKMPPPTPLLLNPASTKNPVIVKAAEPSPLESPERALAYIQAQLKKYEQEPSLAGGGGAAETETPTRRLALLDNLEREMDMQAGHWQEMQHDLRHDSLSTIQTLSPGAESRRQSVLSIHSVAAPQQQQQQSKVASIAADRRAARRSRIQSGTLAKSVPDKKQFLNAVSDLGALGSPTPPDSDDSDVERDLRRPPPSNIGAPATALSGAIVKAAQPKKSLWLPAKSATMTTTTMLWTPGPQVSSHHSTVLFAAIALAQQASSSSSKKSNSGKKSLTAPLPIESVALWTKDADNASHRAHPGRGLWASRSQQKPKPKQQKQQQQQEKQQEQSSAAVAQASAYEESQLQKMQELELEMEAMEEAGRQRMSSSSSSSTSSSSSQKAPRPVTLRPPRRSKRVTMLPDILESPEPLPDKRGTLGIFQFPWGERSDTAKLPSRGGGGGGPPSFMAMPGTMASGGGGGGNQMSAALEARARQLEAAEYSSSFFDDYDDEEEAYDDEEQGFDDDASGSDDGFDETTLWEIASLLKTEQVPSTLSMFPPPLSTGSVVGDYMAEMPSESEVEHYEAERYEAERGDVGDEHLEADEILVGLDSGSSRSARRRDSELWSERQGEWAAENEKKPSLAQPDEETWKSYDNVNRAATLRSKPRKSAQPARVETDQLWEQTTSSAASAAIKTLPANPRSSLWTAATPVQKKASSAKKTTASQQPQQQQQQQQQGSAKMWTPRAKKTASAAGKAGKATMRLFDKDAAAAAKTESAVTRTTDREPAALSTPRTPRTPSRAPLERLMSSSLWTSASGHTSRMWAPMPVPKLRARGPLFDRDAAAVEKLRLPVRTTAMEPVAATATARARVPRSLSHLPELRLESSSLWTAASAPKKQTQRNWIMTKDPKDAKTPPPTVAVVAAVVTEDIIPASSVGVKQKTWWEKMKAAAGVSTQPASAPAAKMVEAKPPVQQQQRIQRPAASSSDWVEALQDAAAASYPWLQRRISATPGQWDAALDLAVARSYPFDAARGHPALAGAAPASPASPVANDASKVHPVFFRSAQETVVAAKQTSDVVIQLRQAAPAPVQTSAEDAAYHAHIKAMENQALARLQALEGGARGVVLRY